MEQTLQMVLTDWQRVLPLLLFLHWPFFLGSQGTSILLLTLNIMYIPNVGEIVVFISAFLGALIGFLWFNTYPAEIFMGDTGSLTLGAVISVIAIIVRKELLIPLIVWGLFYRNPIGDFASQLF